MQLNPEQQKAVSQIEWPLLILAGAGSGKTATLTARIAHMIGAGNIPPSSILALTFTNKAAGEMKERVSKVLGVEYRKNMFQNQHLPYLGTFHSFGIFILKQVLSDIFPVQASQSEIIGLKKDFLIYDESDKISLMKQIIKDELWLIEKEYPARQIAYYISDAKNKSLSPEEYSLEVSNNLQEVVQKVYERYQKRLCENNAMDFDDILVKLLAAFQIPEILAYYQEKYQYIMVDEYQDTNMVQYEIIRLLASQYKNIAVVGDDWQSIYSWRGADIRNILEFEKDYPNALVIKLEQNYRSTKKIISAANHVIDKNQTGRKKELWTENPEGNTIQYFAAPDDNSEAQFVADEIVKGYEISGSYTENLILYRMNAQSRLIEESLMRKGIPYKVVGWQKFYDRKEVKDILAYLRLLHTPDDTVSFLRVVNTPSRKIGAATLSVLAQVKDDFWLSYFALGEHLEDIDELRAGAKASLQEFFDLMRGLKQAKENLSLSELMGKIIRDTRYEDYLRSQMSADEFLSRQENLTELQNVASEYEWMQGNEALTSFLEDVALISDLDGVNDENDVVTLMTIHSSKGLEQKRVFVLWLEDGIFPSSRSQQSLTSLEEERRLMYVAMTRAREELFLSRAKSRFYFGEYISHPESRFVKEIPEDFLTEIEGKSWFSFGSRISQISWNDSFISPVKIARVENTVSDFKAWIRVEHHKFGIGIVERLIWEIAEIRFKSWMKKMNIRIAPVKILSE